ncbi:Iron uptake protein A1 precursor [compost metagenome]
MNTYYMGQLAGSSDSEDVRIAEELGVFFPNQQTTGTHVNISGIGLVRSSKHTDQALKLVEYLTSKEGQTQLAQQSYEYPVNEYAESADVVKAWGTFKPQRLDFADLETYRPQAIDIFKKAGWK